LSKFQRHGHSHLAFRGDGAHALTDVSTIGLAHVGVLAISPHLYTSVGYDSLNDFAPGRADQ